MDNFTELLQKQRRLAEVVRLLKESERMVRLQQFTSALSSLESARERIVKERDRVA